MPIEEVVNAIPQEISHEVILANSPATVSSSVTNEKSGSAFTALMWVAGACLAGYLIYMYSKPKDDREKS